MSDIVKRLREGRTDGSPHRWDPTPTHLEAADEIERLRAEISHWRESAGDHVSKLLYEAHTEELRAKIERLENECYKKCGVCEFDYGRAAPKEPSP